MLRLLLGIFLVFITNFSLFSQVAKVKNLRGSFDVVRDGQRHIVSDSTFLFQDLDIIFTNEEPVFLSIQKLTGVEGELEISDNSIVLIMLTSLKEEQISQFFVIKGQAKLNLFSLVGRSKAFLRNSHLKAEIPVRGEASLLTLTYKDSLLIPYKGDIKIESKANKTSPLLVRHGVVVELINNKLTTKIVSNNTLSGYQEAWLAVNNDRRQEEAIQTVRFFLSDQAMFKRSFDRVLFYQDLLLKWEEENQGSYMASPEDLELDLNKIQGVLFSVYPYVIPLLEVIYSLEKLPSFKREDFSYNLGSSLTLEKFIERWPSFKEEILDDIWLYFYWLKMYKSRNLGDFLQQDIIF